MQDSARDEIALLLEDSVRLETPVEVLHGPGPVSRFLVSEAAPVPFTADPSNTEVCGRFARDAGTIVTRDHRLVGYRIDWQQDERGVRVARVALSAPPEPSGATLRCAAPVSAAHVAHYRSGVTMLAAPGALLRIGNPADLSDAFRQAGYVGRHRCYASGTGFYACGPAYPRDHRSSLLGMATVDQQVTARFGVEVDGALAAEGYTAGGDSVHVDEIDAERQPAFFTALATANWNYLRIGAGPSLAVTRWTWSLNRDYDPTTSGHGRVDDVDQWSTRAYGASAMIAARMPLASELAASLRWQYGWFPGKDRVKPIQSFTGASVSRGFQFIAGGLELRW